MKIIFTLLISLFVTTFAFAQAPMQTTVEYNGQKYPCYITEYNLPPDEAKSVIENKLKSEGLTPINPKDFWFIETRV